MGEWQPIETAPKDGTQVLGLYHHHGHEPDYSIVRWDRNQWVGMCDGERSIVAQSDFTTEYHAPFVTHWMPLPEPPK